MKTHSPSAECVNPHRQGSAVANAGGGDVDRSATRAPVEAGPEPTSLAGGLESGIDHRFVDEPASGPDVKRAPISDDVMNAARDVVDVIVAPQWSWDRPHAVQAVAEAILAERQRCISEIEAYARAHGQKTEWDNEGFYVDAVSARLCGLLRGEV